MIKDDLIYFKCSHCESLAKVNPEEAEIWNNRFCACGGIYQGVQNGNNVSKS